MKPTFPYKTIMDRVVTNALGEIIFEKGKPAYVIDDQTVNEINNLIAKQQATIDELKTQTNNQELLLSEMESHKIILNSFTTQINEKFQDVLYGLSTDVKPTIDVVTGTIFYEIDTDKTFIFNGTVWVEKGVV